MVGSGRLPVYFELSEGQKHDVKHDESLVNNLPDLNTFIADNGYDSDALRAYVDSVGGESVIPKRNFRQDLVKLSRD